MDMGLVNEVDEVAPLHPNALARRMLHAFASLVEASGGRVTRARLRDFEPPQVNNGTISNHRFDLFGEWTNPRAFNMLPGWFIAEAVVDAKVITDTMVRRWSLLEARAVQANSMPIYYLVPTVQLQRRLEAVLLTKNIAFTRIVVIEEA